MRIAYLCPSINPVKGGIERVTYILRNYFIAKGHTVYCIALRQEENKNEEDLIFLPDNCADYTPGNVTFLNEFLIKNNVDILIAQLGGPSSGSELAASAPKSVKKIACLHLDILDSVRHFGANKYMLLKKMHVGFLAQLFENNILTDLLVRLKKHKYQKGYISLTEQFDKIVLLSDSFINDYEYIAGKNGLLNLTSMPNPLPFMENIEAAKIIKNKSKTLLYVGRVNTGQKKVDYLLRIWSLLHLKYPNWNLKIVGDGPDLEMMKRYAHDLELKNYSFEGYQSPEKYYADAPILCLTSSYEGFGMVLIEAMRYGVVPVAFDSYASVKDIIDDKKNGLLVNPFNLNEYANALSMLMTNVEQRESMAYNSIIKADTFTISNIGERWLQLFEKLLH